MPARSRLTRTVELAFTIAVISLAAFVGALAIATAIS